MSSTPDQPHIIIDITSLMAGILVEQNYFNRQKYYSGDWDYIFPDEEQSEDQWPVDHPLYQLLPEGERELVKAAAYQQAKNQITILKSMKRHAVRMTVRAEALHRKTKLAMRQEAVREDYLWAFARKIASRQIVPWPLQPNLADLEAFIAKTDALHVSAANPDNEDNFHPDRWDQHHYYHPRPQGSLAAEVVPGKTFRIVAKGGHKGPVNRIVFQDGPLVLIQDMRPSRMHRSEGFYLIPFHALSQGLFLKDGANGEVVIEAGNPAT